MTGLRSLLLLIIAGVMVFAPAHTQPVDGGHARVELISERALAIPGETVWFGLSFEIDPKWHVYWINPGDAGIAPEITWSNTSGLDAERIGDFKWAIAGIATRRTGPDHGLWLFRSGRAAICGNNSGRC